MKKQNGFSAVEGLLIILVIALIGFGGWYEWKHDDQKPAENLVSTQETNVASSGSDDQPAAPEDWKQYTNQDFNLSFYHPSDWSVNVKPYGELSLALLSPDYSAPLNEAGNNTIESGYNLDVSVNTTATSSLNDFVIPSNCEKDTESKENNTLVVSCDEGFEYRKHLYLLKNNRIYEFDVSGSVAEVGAVDTLFDQLTKTVTVQ